MFDWGDYLALAERLAAETDNEAAQRTAISRAYYAAYHAAAAFVRDKGMLETGHSHRAVWAAFVADGDRARVRVGWKGHLLKLTRLDADYRRPLSGDLATLTKQAIADARDVIETLDRLS